MSMLDSSFMIPATRNMTIRGPLASAAALKLPFPLSLRFVTSITRPPRPPVANMPPPQAPGKAGTPSGSLEGSAGIWPGAGKT